MSDLYLGLLVGLGVGGFAAHMLTVLLLEFIVKLDGALLDDDD